MLAAQAQVLPIAPEDTIVPDKVRAAIDVLINGEHFRHTGDPKLPLLWYLRDVLRLTGTKIAGEQASTGADLVLLDGKPVPAASVSIEQLAGREVLTVEGLAANDGTLHPLQQAFIDEDAVGCGYCTPGFVVSLFAVVAYSAKGLRFKERPFLDSLTSSTHFVSPAVFGLALAAVTPTWPLVAVLTAYFLWGMASHAFGAVQDIQADREGGIGSVATVIGGRATVRLALALYLVAGVLLLFTSWPGPLAAALVVPYAVNVAPWWNVTDVTAASANRGNCSPSRAASAQASTRRRSAGPLDTIPTPRDCARITTRTARRTSC